MSNSNDWKLVFIVSDNCFMYCYTDILNNTYIELCLN